MESKPPEPEDKSPLPSSAPADKPVASATPKDPNWAAEVLQQPDGEHTSAKINLLGHDDTPASPAPVPAVEIAPQKVKDKPGRRFWLPVILIATLALTGTGIAAYVYLPKPTRKVVTPTPSTPAPAPAAGQPPAPPPPAPPPAPAPAPPASQTVTTPTVTPTADHPQTVTVQSKSGLWLRSTPDSTNQKNVIGWIPNGAQVSVDKVGDFWWHGTYRGQAGYFASKYTQ